MWFLPKQKKQKQEKTSAVPFLRKSLPDRRIHRTAAKKGRQRIGLGTLSLWALFFGTLFYTACFSIFFSIGEPKIAGTNGIPEAILRTFVNSQLSEKYLRIFPRNNFFLVRPTDLESRLRQEYPLLASVSVKRLFPDELSISVTERKKIILWNSSDRTFLIDEEGRAHDSTRAFLPENIQYALFITDMSQKQVTLGEKVYDAGYGAFIIQMDELFSQQLGLGLEPRFTTVSRFANELRVKTAEGWEAYFGTDIPIEASFNVLRLLFEKELPIELRAKLAYIDLRAENRAYYAFREGENPAGVSPPIVVEVKKAVVETKKKK